MIITVAECFATPDGKKHDTKPDAVAHMLEQLFLKASSSPHNAAQIASAIAYYPQVRASVSILLKELE